uniref:Cl3646_1 n=1 Tax=Arundo donax TaxID=35708 RepID=A0A0A9GPP9_ARUDO
MENIMKALVNSSHFYVGMIRVNKGSHQYEQLRLFTTGIRKKFLQRFKQKIVSCCIGTCRNDRCQHS